MLPCRHTCRGVSCRHSVSGAWSPPPGRGRRPERPRPGSVGPRQRGRGPADPQQCVAFTSSFGAAQDCCTLPACSDLTGTLVLTAANRSVGVTVLRRQRPWCRGRCGACRSARVGFGRAPTAGRHAAGMGPAATDVGGVGAGPRRLILDAIPISVSASHLAGDAVRLQAAPRASSTTARDLSPGGGCTISVGGCALGRCCRCAGRRRRSGHGW